MHPDIEKLTELIAEYEFRSSDELFAKIVSDLARDRDNTIATMRMFGDSMFDKYKSDWGTRAYTTAIAAAWGDTADPRGDALLLELAPRMFRDGGEAAFVNLEPHIVRQLAGKPQRELAMRLACERERFSSLYSEGATKSLRVADRLATTDRDRLFIATRIALQLRERIDDIERGGYREHDTTPTELAAVRAEHGVVFGRCVSLANQFAGNPDPEVRLDVICADVEVSLTDPVLAHRHITRAEEMSRGMDGTVRNRVVYQLAELLLEADLLERADAVATELVDDEGVMPPILEEIRRRRGLLAAPSPLEFVAPANAEDEVIYGIADGPELPDGFAKYFTFAEKPVTAIKRLATRETIFGWSQGWVRSAAELGSQRIFGPIRSFACECGRTLGVKWGGEVCERCLVDCCTTMARQVRVGHIKLREKVLHPWHASTVAVLLKRSERDVATANVATLERDLEPVFAKIRAYEYFDMPERDPRFKAMETISSESLDVSAFLLDVLPVAPPAWPRIRDHAAIARAYAEILEGDDVRGAVHALFAQFLRLAI